MKRATSWVAQAMLAVALVPRWKAHARLDQLTRGEGAQLGRWQALLRGSVWAGWQRSSGGERWFKQDYGTGRRGGQ